MSGFHPILKSTSPSAFAYEAAGTMLRALVELASELRTTHVLAFVLVALVFSAKTINGLFWKCVPGGIQRPPPRFDSDIYYYAPPKPGDSRSPCPALNTLANHGYLPRNGRAITVPMLAYALQQGFRLTPALAWFLSTGGAALLRQGGALALADLSRHGRIEHNASLAHADAPAGDGEDAPTAVNPALLAQLLAHARRDDSGRRRLAVEDVARARVRREEQSTVAGVAAEIARGEVALVLDIFGGEERKIDAKMLRAWWTKEEFPKGWAPVRPQTFERTVLTSQILKRAMEAERAGVEVPAGVLEQLMRAYVTYTTGA